MIRLLYTILLSIFAPILLISLYRHRPNKPPFGSRWKEHFGITPLLNASSQPIWIHTVSVGEVVAASKLIKQLKSEFPESPILVTTTTSTGAEQVKKLGNIVEHRYMPIDLPFAVKGFLKKVKPKVMLIMETELWPNTLHQAAKSNIPVIVLNARLSEKSYLRYAKIQPVFNWLAENINFILCQHRSDAERFQKLDIPTENILTTGSLKFDISISPEVEQQASALRIKLGENRPVWIAASTHRGEDGQLLEAHKILLKEHPNLLLVLVPRHPERFSSVTELTQKYNFNVVTRSSHQNISPETQVYIGDTMGEMLTLIGASDVCFMAGSLLGRKVGGHNVLEPAALGIPIVTGPSYFNFKEITEQLIKINVCKVAYNKQEIVQHVTSLLSNAHLREQASINAKYYLKQNQGAVSKTISFLDTKLES